MSHSQEYQVVPAGLLGICSQETTKPRVEQLEYGVWLVHNVLSKAECAAVREAGTQQLEMVKGALDSQRYRDLKRSIFMCPEAADIVYKRLESLSLFKDDVEVCKALSVQSQTCRIPALKSGMKRSYACWRIRCSQHQSVMLMVPSIQWILVLAVGRSQNTSGLVGSTVPSCWLTAAAENLRILVSNTAHCTVQVLESDDTIHQGSLEGVSGVWKPYALNACWRVLQYEAGGHFSPHFDSEYVCGPGKKSLRTFMIYLNTVPKDSGVEHNNLPLCESAVSCPLVPLTRLCVEARHGQATYPLNHIGCVRSVF